MSAKYRNPDTPVGYVRNVRAEVRYEEGDMIDGVHCLFMGLVIESGLFDTDTDNSGLSDLVLSDDDDIEVQEEVIPEKVIKVETIEDEDEDKSSKKKDEDTIRSEKSYSKKKEDKEEHKEDKIRSEKSYSKKKEYSKKKIKREYSDESDDDSDYSSSYSRHRKRSSKRRSRSPRSRSPRSPSPGPSNATVKVKEEPKEAPDHLFGCYPCEVCHITMNSLLTYTTHVNGKRHQKNLKAKNVCKTVAKTIPSAPTEATSKYPKPGPGIQRMPLKVRAEIQSLIEREVKTPLPGLNHVIEIQGVKDVQYYCHLCDSVCSTNSIIPHLTGFKHQMKTLKFFMPPTYERICDLPKYRIDKEVLSHLRDLEKKHGLGKMAVEKEVLTYNPNAPVHDIAYPSTSQGMPSTSSKRPGTVSLDYYQMTTIPDTSSSDFYCRICESHMNSEAMWQSHIRGKRHLTNIKKMPGAMPSKTKTIQVPNAHAFLLERLEDIDEPVVGLNEIQETQVPETQTETYTCFLCGACLTSVDIIDHLLSIKHRTKFLEHIQYPGLAVTVGMRDPYALIAGMCADVEEREGRGSPKVHIAKSNF